MHKPFAELKGDQKNISALARTYHGVGMEANGMERMVSWARVRRERTRIALPKSIPAKEVF